MARNVERFGSTGDDDYRVVLRSDPPAENIPPAEIPGYNPPETDEDKP